MVLKEKIQKFRSKWFPLIHKKYSYALIHCNKNLYEVTISRNMLDFARYFGYTSGKHHICGYDVYANKWSSNLFRVTCLNCLNDFFLMPLSVLFLFIGIWLGGELSYYLDNLFKYFGL